MCYLSSSPVTGCYDNKHFEVHSFKDTKQSSLNILSLEVLLLVVIERVKLSMFGVPLYGIKCYMCFYS